MCLQRPDGVAELLDQPPRVGVVGGKRNSRLTIRELDPGDLHLRFSKAGGRQFLFANQSVVPLVGQVPREMIRRHRVEAVLVETTAESAVRSATKVGQWNARLRSRTSGDEQKESKR